MLITELNSKYETATVINIKPRRVGQLVLAGGEIITKQDVILKESPPWVPHFSLSGGRGGAAPPTRTPLVIVIILDFYSEYVPGS